MRLVAEKVLKDVGRRLAEIRAERGLTQEAVAEKLAVSTRYVQTVEAGRVNLSLRALVDWANTLNATLASLVEAPTTRRSRPGRPPKTRQPE